MHMLYKIYICHINIKYIKQLKISILYVIWSQHSPFLNFYLSRLFIIYNREHQLHYAQVKLNRICEDISICFTRKYIALMYRKNYQNGYNHERYRVGGGGVAHNRKDKLAQIFFFSI